MEMQPAPTASTAPAAPAAPAEPGGRMGWGKLLLLILVVVVLTAGATVWVMTHYVFPREFKPVQLSAREEVALNQKLDRLDPAGHGPRVGPAAEKATKAEKVAGSDGTKAESAGGAARLEPERYSEAGAKREVSFSTRELNALLASNTDMAQRLAIDLSQDMASVKLLVPVDPEFPVLGGKTIKLNAGLELRYAGNKPVVALTGVSLWGVPIPNAWLGGLKHVDLVGEFGGDQGFWSAFAAGIEHISVTDGQLTIKLKE